MLGGVGNWLAQPENKSALLQFSIAALQPQGGNSTLGHLANAVGEGASARDRNVLATQKAEGESIDQELDRRRLDLVEAQTSRTSRLAAGGSGGRKQPTWAQMWAAKARDEKGFQNWVKTIAAGEVDPTSFEDPDVLVGQWLSDPSRVASLRAQYAEYQKASGAAVPGDPLAPAPVAPNGPPAEVPSQGGALLEQAKQAIQRGAPRDAVIQRLRERGIDPTGL